MDFRLWRIIAWVVLLVWETFVGTFDLLALWFAALLTALISYMFWIHMHNREWASLIFLWAGVVSILVSRWLVLPKIKWTVAPEPMSGEAVIWTKMPIQKVNNKLVVRYEWVYWNIESKESVEVGDIVTVIAMHGNHLVVRK